MPVSARALTVFVIAHNDSQKHRIYNALALRTSGSSSLMTAARTTHWLLPRRP